MNVLLCGISVSLSSPLGVNPPLLAFFLLKQRYQDTEIAAWGGRGGECGISVSLVLSADIHAYDVARTNERCGV